VPAQAQGRFDLRDIPLVITDGEDARDFDDAVFADHAGDTWRLIVAIADVSYYVKPGAALDREAYARGNSVYFPQHVIPMLPEALSNGLCSINPHVDRLCMACEMQIDGSGKILKYRFLEAVMRSRARLTYTKVAPCWWIKMPRCGASMLMSCRTWKRCTAFTISCTPRA
jgi:ribonuclease R